MDDIYYFSNGKVKTTIIDNLIIDLYENKGRLLDDKELKEHKLTKDYNDNVKIAISKYTKRVPLYSVHANMIFLIFKENIFPRINYDKYRFINKQLLTSFNSSEDKFMIDFMSNYDIKILEETYMKIFYQSFVMNSYITNCRRPSFSSGLDHIEPYYSSTELYYLAYDLNLIEHPDFSEGESEDLCKKITAYDIPSKTLTDHQLYIYNSRSIGLVKHYSLFGSYFMNKYLRDYYCCFQSDEFHRNQVPIINSLLEIQIKLMINLIRHAPEFCQRNDEFTVYRFIDNDTFLKSTKIGDIYKDPSFMSTTRNPFYYQENYKFGYILMKIKIPINIKGIGLSIESYSNFPKEEEIIFPPTTRLRLDKITTEHESHIHVLNKKVTTKYEFTLLGNDYMNNSPIELYMPDGFEPPIPLVDMKILMKNPDIIYTTMTDRLKFFTKNYVNSNFQFQTLIGSRNVNFIMESYDSSSVYKDFFFYKTTSGLMIYSFNPKYGNINIIIELNTEIHVNYYFKFSVTDSSHQLDLNDKDWIMWLSLLSYVIGSRSVIIHGNYFLQYDNSDTKAQIMKTRYTYCDNIYQYLKYKKKFFSDFVEVIAEFDYNLLDNLVNYSTNDILNIVDKDELYQISIKNVKMNVSEYYVFIVENYPKLIPVLESKMNRIFQIEKNPFDYIYYRLDTWAHLYNNNIIKSMPSDKDFNFKKGSFRSLIGDKKIPQFKNRLRAYLQKNN